MANRPTIDPDPLHPIQRARVERTGMNRADFGALCGVDYLTIYATEQGRRAAPRRLLEAIVSLGLHPDTDVLASDCDTWRQNRAAHMAHRIGLTNNAPAASVGR